MNTKQEKKRAIKANIKEQRKLTKQWKRLMRQGDGKIFETAIARCMKMARLLLKLSSLRMDLQMIRSTPIPKFPPGGLSFVSAERNSEVIVINGPSTWKIPPGESIVVPDKFQFNSPSKFKLEFPPIKKPPNE